MLMKKNNTCDPCEEDFWRQVNELVDEVKGYTKEDHMKKEKEVDEAFGKENKNEPRR